MNTRTLRRTLAETETRLDQNKALAREQHAGIKRLSWQKLKSPWMLAGACAAGVVAGRFLFRRRPPLQIQNGEASSLGQKIVATLRLARRWSPWISTAFAAANWLRSQDTPK